MAAKQHPQIKDCERYSAIRREGYTSLAAWMTLDPDKEALIFRKFDYLSARRTLHLQSQLLELEERLQNLDAEVSKNVESKKSLKKHEIFEERSGSGGSTDEQRMKLLDEIHIKLIDYHNTLLLQSQIADLSQPRTKALQAYRTYFRGKGPHDRIIFGKAQELLEDKKDLATLRPPSDVDILSRFVRDHWPQRFAELHLLPGETTLRFQEKQIQLVVGLINIVVAAILIIGAVVSLFKLRTRPDPVRLGMIAAFTAVFSVSVGLLTNAKRAEIFAATAAYAAVLVVFVSGDLGGSSKNNT
ncbi:hypothetical protein K469DRAFT_750444 [Zopfia rhizophila CBS 207.26]|uniref:DUF6594 domain-containing protein n=1 Tax=Zopfia rhizophila CBS 207.26 TaxID=1314779 RepID=A0A6A6E0E4_9PEZI|nr:hypothetical protein K469DRAFT_750444 [Zopfia rhizophila CBS 207.26]